MYQNATPTLIQPIVFMTHHSDALWGLKNICGAILVRANLANGIEGRVRKCGLKENAAFACQDK